MDSRPNGSSLSISDNPRVSGVRNQTNLPSENSRIPRLWVSWFTMVVSLMVDIFPSNASMSIPGGLPLSSLSGSL